MKKALFTLLIGFIGSGVINAAEVIPTKSVRLLVVNEQETDSKTEPAILNQGKNQIVVSMSKSVGRGSNERVFDSKPFILQFSAEDENIEIIAPAVYSYEQATNHFKKNPDWKVLSNDQPVEFTMEELPARTGMLPYYDVDEMIAEYNKENGIFFGEEAKIIASATLAGTSVVMTEGANEQVAAVSKTTMSSKENLDQLKAWYLKASKAERKEFRRWMIDQE